MLLEEYKTLQGKPKVLADPCKENAFHLQGPARNLRFPCKDLYSLSTRASITNSEEAIEKNVNFQLLITTIASGKHNSNIESNDHLSSDYSTFFMYIPFMHIQSENTQELWSKLSKLGYTQRRHLFTQKNYLNIRRRVTIYFLFFPAKIPLSFWYFEGFLTVYAAFYPVCFSRTKQESGRHEH